MIIGMHECNLVALPFLSILELCPILIMMKIVYTYNFLSPWGITIDVGGTLEDSPEGGKMFEAVVVIVGSIYMTVGYKCIV